MALIKCPECSHEVSDKAPQCPYCGVAIANNTTICPDCGKVVLSSERVCSNCGCALGSAADAAPRNGASYPSLPQTPRRGKRRKSYTALWIFLSVAILLLLAVGAFMVYRYVEHQKALESEYLALQGSIDIPSYEHYLNKFPQSPYVRDVVERLNELRNIAAEWDNIKGSLSKAKYLQFMDDHPQSAYDSICRQWVDSLDWEEVYNENTIASYNRYISDHPDGYYIEDAKEGKDFLKRTVITWEEKNDVRLAVRKYYEIISNNNVEALGSVTSNSEYKVSAPFMEQLWSGNSRVSFWLQTGVSVTKAPNKSTGYLYIAKYQVASSIYSKTGAHEAAYYNATTMLLPDKRISSTRLVKTEKPQLAEEDNS